jgi:hypothetical protein
MSDVDGKGGLRLARLAMCWLLAAGFARSAHTLPRGYKDDFNGCATQSADDTDRARCCKETFSQCQAQCQKDFADQGDYNEAIGCGSECLDAHEKCRDGQTVPLQPGWPGLPGVIVQGMLVEGDRAVPAKGYDLAASRGAVLVELRVKAEPASNTCTAFVVACACPAGAEARGQECRAWNDRDAVACRICRRGEPAESCKPCPDCRPELLSAQQCAAPERSAPRHHDSKK